MRGCLYCHIFILLQQIKAKCFWKTLEHFTARWFLYYAHYCEPSTFLCTYILTMILSMYINKHHSTSYVWYNLMLLFKSDPWVSTWFFLKINRKLCIGLLIILHNYICVYSYVCTWLYSYFNLFQQTNHTIIQQAVKIVIAILFVIACVSSYFYQSSFSVYYDHNSENSKTLNFVQDDYVPRTTNATNTSEFKSEVTKTKTLKEIGT